MISLFVFCLSISKRNSCSRALRRRAAIDDDRRSFGGDEPPLLVLIVELPGDIGGDDVVGLDMKSGCIFGGGFPPD